MAVHYWLGWSGSVKAASVGGLNWVLTSLETAHVFQVRGSEQVAAAPYVLSWLTRLSERWTVSHSCFSFMTCSLADHRPLTGQSPTHVQTLTVHLTGVGKGLAESGGPSKASGFPLLL